MQHICKICNQELTNPQGLSAHCRLKHKMKAEDVYIEYFLNGIPPICACGCGERPKYLGIYEGFREYIHGHASRVHNNWGHNPNANKKSHETQKKLYQSGKLIIWNKGLTVKTDERVKKNGLSVSKYKKTDEHIRKIKETQNKNWLEKYDELVEKCSKQSKEYWSKEENKTQQRFKRVEYFKNKLSSSKSKLEQKFEDMLVELNIQFINQHPLNGYLYDFYLPKHNLLIEVDGDWFHCNPDVYPEAIHEIQKFVIENDERKNLVAKENNIPLLRFWEKDINENFDMVKSELSRYL